MIARPAFEVASCRKRAPGPATLPRHAGVAAPKPPRRCPFKAGSLLARQYEGMLKAYATGHRDVIRTDEGRDGRTGAVRCMGNAWADNFWLGYDGTPPYRVPKATLAWACYRAGQAQRLLDDRRGVFVPPKTNSVVPKS